jgi:hypothetical protein
MKYLKLFEDSNKYYKQITHQECSKIVFDRDNTIEFSNNESQELDILMSDLKINYRKIVFNYDDNDICYQVYTKSGFKLVPLDLVLYKVIDEWYYISIFKLYYKCDQFDGLLLCLKDNLWNIIENVRKEPRKFI